ncbi:MAG: WYL domain-containing protein, partial [Clostridia bacterium]|nr:WYL domain-containing protein [Clostridia bacterium]
FEPRASEPAEHDGNPVAPPFTTIRLRFQPQALHRIYDYFGEDRIVRNPDGTCAVELSWPEDEWVYGYILSFGCNVEVVEPAHIRAIIADRLKKSLAYYE